MRKSGIKKGILSMRVIKEILRLYEMGISQVKISKSCNVSRTTVRDYISKASVLGLNSEHIAKMEKEELMEKFKKKKPERKQEKSDLDYEYIHKEMKKKGVTILLLWEEYLRDNLDGYSYSRFNTKYGNWRKSKGLSLRQVHKAGEKVFIDYCGMKVPIFSRNGNEYEASIFVACLGASNYIYAEATKDQTIESWIGSNIRTLEFFGGVPEIAVPDNLKAGVTSPCRYEPSINPTYQDFAEHYNMAIIPARVRRPKDKAKVETGVQIVERSILAPLRNERFENIAELNIAIKILLSKVNNRQMKSYGSSREELFLSIDKPVLQSLPAFKYQICKWKTAKVNIDYHVQFEHSNYSVPYEFVKQEVEIKIHEKTLEIFHKNKLIAFHNRLFIKGHQSTVKEHMPKAHRYMMDWNPSRFLEWGGKIGCETRRQIEKLLYSREHPEQSYRACMGLLRLGNKYGAKRLEKACEKVNGVGIVSYKRIKSILENSKDKVDSETKAKSQIKHSNLRSTGYYH